MNKKFLGLLLIALVFATHAMSMAESELHDAVRAGNVKRLGALLERPEINVNAKDLYGNTSLHLAAYGGHGDCILELTQHGADVTLANNDGQVPLQFAELKGHVACVEILQAAGKKQLEEQG